MSVVVAVTNMTASESAVQGHDRKSVMVDFLGFVEDGEPALSCLEGQLSGLDLMWA
ncbi:hypothetical protein [Streptomyces sp. 4N124]|uniref:hypothetical protein n=1 Tax=Streptomyces sp. 4N124 TaxID=3457420 RepID=UPI003FD4BA78